MTANSISARHPRAEAPLPRADRRGTFAGAAALLLALATLGGCVRQRCYDDGDCPSAQICKAGACRVAECDVSRPCGSGFACVDYRCEPTTLAECPDDMVNIAGVYCIDRYEASRLDATATSYGKDGSRAASVAGVMPWPVADNRTAEQACAAAGKRLCSAEEWGNACRGPDSTAYAYGDAYDPAICNGIDAFGRQGFHPTPTGSFPQCTNEWGVYDLNGNLWEHVAGGSDMTVRGGAYNCNDSASLHRCDYVPGNWVPSALGFRCCLTPTGQPRPLDSGAPERAPDGAGDATVDGGGCLAEDDGGPTDVTGPVDAGADADRDATGGEEAGADVPLGADVLPPDAGPDVAADVAPDAASSTDGGPAACPPEMVLVGAFCVDRYEASRQDATATSAGSDETVAWSRAGVLPWYVNPMSAAALGRFEAACQAAGKRLCTSDEWLDTCQGPGRSRYFFGDDWDPTICNSVDTHCRECCDLLGLATCPTGENCGYSAELTSSYTPETCFISADYGRDTCHVCYHVMPTGAFPRCTNGSGLFDVNGNVWEVVPVPTTDDSRGYQVRGGAFNCGSPSSRFACVTNASWDDLYAGFRCCKAAALP